MRKRERGGSAICHPEKPHFAKGLCETCYNKQPDRVEKRRVYAHKQYREKYRANGHEMQRQYGITIDQYNDMLYEQGGMCAICGREDSGRKGSTRLHIDHDHKTGQVRGLLCDYCNRGIGCFSDKPDLVVLAFLYLYNAMVKENERLLRMVEEQSKSLELAQVAEDAYDAAARGGKPTKAKR